MVGSECLLGAGQDQSGVTGERELLSLLGERCWRLAGRQVNRLGRFGRSGRQVKVMGRRHSWSSGGATGCGPANLRRLKQFSTSHGERAGFGRFGAQPTRRVRVILRPGTAHLKWVDFTLDPKLPVASAPFKSPHAAGRHFTWTSKSDRSPFRCGSDALEPILSLASARPT